MFKYDRHTTVMPDSRLRYAWTPKAVNRGVAGFCVPIYCVSCGKRGGEVPQENMTFAYWMCNPCFVLYGHLTAEMPMPDEVFWEQLKNEQLENYGRLLSNEELLTIVAADASPLATLIKQGRYNL